jgi:hypothetical protein
MEILIGLGIILAVNEWRDYKSKQKFKLIENRIKKISRQLHFIGDLSAKIDSNNALIQANRKELEPIKDFISEAHTDLKTIVQEYEVNGVPLGYDRGKPNFDMVEGV